MGADTGANKKKKLGCAGWFVLGSFLCLFAVIILVVTTNALKTPAQKAKERATAEVNAAEDLRRSGCHDFLAPWNQIQSAIKAKNGGSITESDMIALFIDAAGTLQGVAAGAGDNLPEVSVIADDLAKIRVDYINSASSKADWADLRATYDQLKTVCVRVGAWTN